MHYLVREPRVSEGTLVLVHGLGTSSSTWLKIVGMLPQQLRIIAPDLPGFGFSKLKGPEGFADFQQHRAALTSFLKRVPSEPMVLLGHSFGGWLCSWYAALNPDRVNHLILVNSVGVYYRGIESLRETFTVNSVSDTRRLLNGLWRRYPWYYKPLTGSIYRELTRRHVNDIVASVDFKDLLVEELSGLTMPVSVIWGKNDGVVSYEVVDAFLKIVPRVKLQLLENCGHVPQLERPSAFAQALNRALKRK